MKSPVLVSRAPELTILRGALGEVLSGSGRSVLVQGEPGVGKSRIVATLVEEARAAGAVVLSGRAVRAVSPTPLRPLSQALLGWLRTEGAATVHEAPGIRPFRPALARLAPEFTPTDAEVPAEQATSLVLLGEGLLRLLAGIGTGRGVVLVVEDLHWADPESMTVLEYVADNLAYSPVLLLTTSRPLPPAAAESMASLATRGLLEIIDLAPLDATDVRGVVESCLGGPAPREVGQFVEDHAAGLPLLVEELLTGLIAEGVLAEGDGGWHTTRVISATVPQTFARNVQQRLAALPPGVQGVARAAALLSNGFDWAVIPRALGMPETEVLEALRVLVDRQILESLADGSLDFRHALTREAVRVTMLAPERTDLAARLAEALAGSDAQTEAELHELAGADDDAAQAWVRGARDALATGALATAATMVDRGRQLVDETGEAGLSLREVQVEISSLAGDYPEALRVGRALVGDLVERDAPPDRVAGVRLRMARAAWASGRLDEADELLDATGDVDPAAAAVLRAGLALARFDARTAEQQARLALEAAGEDRPDLACEAWEVIGKAERGRDVVRAEEAFEAGFRVAERAGLGHWRSRLLTELAALDAIARRPSEDRLLLARESAIASGSLVTAALVDWHLNVVRIRYHDLEGALAAGTASIEQMTRLQIPLLGPAYLLRAFAMGLAGRFEDMEADIATGKALDPDNIVILAGEHAHTRAPVALAYARYEEARQEFALGMDYYRRYPGQSFSMRGIWALLETVLGDGAEAREEVRTGEQASSPNNWFALRYADAVAAGRAGDKATAEQIFADAESTMPGREPWMEHHLRALVARAAAADGWGDPAGWFRRALDGMVEVGQVEAASATRAAMRAAGIPVPRRGKGTQRVPAHLQRLGVTTREYDVLELVVQGLTNQAIAERLFLSPRTVEVHVARLLQRTGASARTGLGAILAEGGAQPDPVADGA